jgi:hypothetical protein
MAGPKQKLEINRSPQLVELREKAVESEEDYKKYRREYRRLYHKNYKNNFKLVEEIARSGDVVGAYAKLFPNVKDPWRSLKSRMEQYPDLAMMMPKLLDAQGLSLITGTSKLRDLLDAEKAVVVDKRVEMYPDHGVQTENLKTLFKLHKVLGEGTQVNLTQNKVEFNCGAEEIEKLGEIVKKIEELEKNVDFSKHIIEVKDATDGVVKI